MEEDEQIPGRNGFESSPLVIIAGTFSWCPFLPERHGEENWRKTEREMLIVHAFNQAGNSPCFVDPFMFPCLVGLG